LDAAQRTTVCCHGSTNSGRVGVFRKQHVQICVGLACF